MKKLFSKTSKIFSLDNFTLLIGLIGQLASYVQALEIFSTGSAGSVSLPAVLISISSVICWIKTIAEG